MPVRGENVEQGAARLRRRWLWWLIGGRVLMAGLLLGVSAAPAPLAQIRDRVSADWITKQASDRARAASSLSAALAE